VWDTSTFLKIELNNIERDTGLITDVRGNGTFLGFDVQEAEQADSVHRWLLKRGIVTARAGPSTIGLRPALILGPSHAANLRDALKSYHPNHGYNE
jgi:acetylornithine/succinyldiaminopimelate/putrescine aminotransferase